MRTLWVIFFLSPNTPEVGRPHAGSWKVTEAPWYQLDSSARGDMGGRGDRYTFEGVSFKFRVSPKNDIYFSA